MKQIFLAITVIFFISCTILEADTVLNETQLLKDSKEIYSLMGNLNRAVADKNSKRIRDIADLDSKEANVKETADFALKILAKTIILQAQKHGFKYCRWGGEEFLLLGKCRSGEIPKDILEELRSAISSNCVRTSRESFRYTVTIGAGKYTSGQSAKEWLDFVDKQLYKGKRSGKNQVVCS